uniref:OxPP cycle protein OpcA n=1 Tax=Planktothrix pseudagardhii TaxID=132604 RepID=A0A9W4CIJ5_9CYAN|nr:Putative OxPP cycle protein OpcA [Planktothrix pseudagardhii]
MTEKAYESVTFGEAGTGVLEIPKVAIEGIWRFSEMSIDQQGDYDIKHIRFIGPNDKEILAELAAIPTADYGEIPGDLVGLRLTSGNPNANCCTILCSETTGCMRMEAGGSAQSCRTEQVIAATDQKAESLMAQQLQRWGQDVLYEESLGLTAQILKLQ